jgi:NADPH-dependent 2,4-dienoyl-CoA reductase/sulfur reductase-like enzyme
MVDRSISHDGTQLPYDRLLVATGSSPSLPPLPGTGLPGVVTCWTLEDAHQIAAKLVPGARVVMLGAGFVAGVCMKSLVNSGAKLSVVAGRSGQILRSMMTPVGSACCSAGWKAAAWRSSPPGAYWGSNRARAWSWTAAASTPT